MSRAAAGLLLLLAATPLPAHASHLTGQALPVNGLAQGDQFGGAVAVAGNVIAVGAYSANGGAGAVYVFRRAGAKSSWTQAGAPLTAGGPGARFGFDVALDPDGARLLVGAPGAGGCGKAFLFNMSNERPSLLAELSAPPPCQPGAEFGSAVAISDQAIAVGARGADQRAGRVSFSLDGGETFRQLGREDFEGLAPRRELGQSLALDGSRLVAGAPAPYLGTDSQGAAYVIDLKSPDPLTATPLSPPALKAGAAFGYAVAISGGQIAVGAPLAGADAGAVFRYGQSMDGTWLLEPAPVQSGARGDQLGVAVALDGDLLVAGARYAGDRKTGAAYIVGHPPLVPEDAPGPGAEFGVAATVDGQIVVIGAFRQDGRGAAYVFEPALLPTVQLEPVSGPTGHREVGVDEGDRRVQVKVTVVTEGDAPLPGEVTVRLRTTPVEATDGTNDTPGDYDPISKKIVLTEGKRSETVEIAIVDDQVCEPHETFTVTLFDPVNAQIRERGSLTVKILNDDAGDILLTPAAVATSENGPAVPLQIRLTCRPTAPVIVSLSASRPFAHFVPAQVRFVPERWNVPARVQVVGLDDTACGLISPALYTITASTTSTDPAYRPASVPASHADDEVDCVAGTMEVCPAADGTVIYTAVLSNTGSDPQEDLASHEFYDALPPELSVVSASATSGVATVDYAGDVVAWNGRIPGDGEVMITIIAALHPVPAGTRVRNSASLTFDHDDDGTLEVAQTDEDPFTGGPEDPTCFKVGDPCPPPPCSD